MANNPDGLDDWSRDFTWLNGTAVRYYKYGTPRAVEVTDQYGAPRALTQQMYYAQQGNVVETGTSGARGLSASMPTTLVDAGGGAGGTSGLGTGGLTGAQKSALAVLQDQLSQWGITDLYGDAESLLKEGLDPAAITVQLSNSASYKRRFSANDVRRQNGLSVLTPAEYIAAEDSYRGVLRQYGLPTSFYDSADDFHQFLGNDVSPDELNDRAQIAQQVWLSNDDNTKTAWRSFYGLSDGAAIAAILDPTRATPIIERMANAARFGGLALANGLEADRGRLEQYSDQGVDASAIASAFGKIALTRGTDDRIGQRFNKPITQADEESALITGNGVAQKKINDLYANETALFQSRAAAESGALSRTSGGKF